MRKAEVILGDEELKATPDLKGGGKLPDYQ